MKKVVVFGPGPQFKGGIANYTTSLAKALEKTQKLLNALENVIIPQYQQKIRFILATLEEREREEFAKLKKVKAKMVSRK